MQPDIIARAEAHVPKEPPGIKGEGPIAFGGGQVIGDTGNHGVRVRVGLGLGLAPPTPNPNQVIGDAGMAYLREFDAAQFDDEQWRLSRGRRICKQCANVALGRKKCGVCECLRYCSEFSTGAWKNERDEHNGKSCRICYDCTAASKLTKQCGRCGFLKARLQYDDRSWRDVCDVHVRCRYLADI